MDQRCRLLHRIGRAVFTLIALVLFAVPSSAQPGLSQYYQKAERDGFELTKTVTDVSVPSGRNFQYHITFSIPAGATNVTISDMIPSSLEYVSHSAYVNQTCSPGTAITPTITLPTPGNPYTLQIASAPCGAVGSFTLIVRFPAGVTCDGAAARNNVCISYQVNGKAGEFCTGYVSTSARAQSTWRVTKAVKQAATNTGSCSNAVNDSVVQYCITVAKSPGIEGQLDLHNAVVTDLLPPGASLIAGSGCMTSSGAGQPLRWVLPTPLLSTYYNSVTCCFSVLYPRALFPIGSQVLNTASVRGQLGDSAGRCGSMVDSSTVCSEFRGITRGRVSKWAVTNGQPGCVGSYFVRVCNNGNRPLGNVQLFDMLPSGVTYVSHAATTTPPTGWTAAYAGGAFSVSSNGTPLAVGACVTYEIRFTVNANAPATINNCAIFSADSIATDTICYAFAKVEPKPVPCLAKTVCSPKPFYAPGDVFTYRLRVQNIGGADMTGTTITDVLNPNLEYVGPVVAYKAGNWNIACGQSQDSWGAQVVTNVVTGVPTTLTFGLPLIPKSCDANVSCGTNATGVDFYFIEFRVKVRDSSVIGTIPNSFTLAGGNLTQVHASNTVTIVVTANTSYFLEKTVRTTGTPAYGESATTTPGGSVDYRLSLRIPTATPQLAALRHVSFIDLLPRNNGPLDAFTMTCGPRGSLFDLLYTGTFAQTPNPSPLGIGEAGDDVYPRINTWAPTGAPLQLFNGGCSTMNPSAWTDPLTPNRRDLGFYFGAGAFVPTSPTYPFVEFHAKASTEAGGADSACNSFVAGAAVRYLINGSTIFDAPIAATESMPACVSVVEDDPCVGCDTVLNEPFIYDNLTLSGKTITILNRQRPVKSAIKTVLIRLVPSPGASGLVWNGGGLVVDGVSRTWSLMNPPNPIYYSEINLNCDGSMGEEGPAAIDDIVFNLGVDWGYNWSGTVEIDVIHCDGDTCSSTFDWCAKPAPGACTTVPVDPGVIDDDSLSGDVYVGTVLVRGDTRVRIGYATIVPELPSGGRIIATGTHETGGRSEGGRSMAAISSSMLFSSKATRGYGALVRFGDGIEPGDSVEIPVILELPRFNRRPTVPMVVSLYDTDGRLVHVDSGRSAGRTSSVAGRETGEAYRGDAVLYTPQPTPAASDVRVAYRLSSSQSIALDLYDDTGAFVTAIASGHREAGEHVSRFGTETLPSGTYVLVLRTPAGVRSQPVIVVH